jgi:hypothetical protein
LTRVVVLALAGVVVLAGCNPPPKKTGFNNSMARANLKLKEKARAFYKVVYDLGTGKPVAASQARSALNDIETALADLKKDYASMKPPAGSSTGATLLEKYRVFLNVEQNIIDACFKPAVAAVENPGLASPAEKWNVIQPLLKQADEMERPAWGDVAKAQRDYAEAYHYTLVQ